MIQDKIIDVQSGYDLVAEEYARRIYDELANKPLDRQLLDRFADAVRDLGMACDLGCGPGQIARYLHERSVRVCGMDLSAEMVRAAKRLNPDIDFHQGDIRKLSVKDNEWAGIAAFYAIVHLSPAELSQALKEMARVLLPGGRLLLSFHIGDDAGQVEELFDSGATLEFRFFRVATVEHAIRRSGMDIEEIIERGPYAPDIEYQSRRAYIFARKPTTKTA